MDKLDKWQELKSWLENELINLNNLMLTQRLSTAFNVYTNKTEYLMLKIRKKEIERILEKMDEILGKDW